MRALVQTAYGDPRRVLHIADVEPPTPTDEQVLVRVHATSINSGDWRRVYANPRWARPMMGGLRRPKDPRFGGDAAGVVEAVGADIKHVKPGDEVYGVRTGAFAEMVAGKSFVRKPANLTFEEAAAVPVAAITALQGLRDHGGLQTGQRVLINGAGGGVGHFAVQIAKALGAEVTATTRTSKVEAVQALGADHVIDYSRDDFSRGDRRFDLLVDMGSPASVSALRRRLVESGTFVQIGAAKGGAGPLGRIVATTFRARALKQRIKFYIAKVNTQDLDTIRDLVETGKVRPLVERTYQFEDIAEAIAYAATENVVGKIVVSVAGSPR